MPGRFLNLKQPGSVNWYCIHTRPQKEAAIAGHLSNKLGLEVYLPRLQLRKTIRRVRRTVLRPLFPRYLFCRLDLGTHYRAVRYAPEVCNIVHFGATPAIVQDALISQIKSWAGDQIDVVTLGLELSPGQTVEITDGPMRGLRAIISHAVSDRERVTVLLSILETEVRLVINRDQLGSFESPGLANRAYN